MQRKNCRIGLPANISICILALGLLALPAGAQTVLLRNYTERSDAGGNMMFPGPYSSWSSLRWTNNVGGVATNSITQTYTNSTPPGATLETRTVTVWPNAVSGSSGTTYTVQGNLPFLYSPYYWYYWSFNLNPVHTDNVSPPAAPVGPDWPHTYTSGSYSNYNYFYAFSSTKTATIDLWTGGSTNPATQALFKLHFSGTDLTTQQAITDYANVTLPGGHPDANGDTYTVLNDHSLVDVTPGVTSHTNYTFSVTAQRGGVDLTVQGTDEDTEENPGAHMCLDESISGGFSINNLGLPGTWRLNYNANILKVYLADANGAQGTLVNPGVDSPVGSSSVGLSLLYVAEGPNVGAVNVSGTFNFTVGGVNQSLSDTVKITVHQPQSATATIGFKDPELNLGQIAQGDTTNAPPTVAVINAEVKVCPVDGRSIILKVKIIGICMLKREYTQPDPPILARHVGDLLYGTVVYFTNPTNGNQSPIRVDFEKVIGTFDSTNDQQISHLLFHENYNEPWPIVAGYQQTGMGRFARITCNISKTGVLSVTISQFNSTDASHLPPVEP